MNYHPYSTTTSTQANSTINHPTYFHPPHHHPQQHQQQNMMSAPATTSGNPVTYYSNGTTPSVIVYSNNASDTTTTIIDTYPLDTTHPIQQQRDPSSDMTLNHSLQFTSWHNNHNTSTSTSAATASTTSLLHPMNNYPLLPSEDDLFSPLPERGVAGFVCKLYQYLEDNDINEKYARWCKHNGKDMFVIDCIPKFAQLVLPKLFKHSKFASFVRQLNIYGFQRDTDARKSKDSRDRSTCRWYHEYFRPERRDLFHLIRRRAPRYSRKRQTKLDTENESTQVSNDESDHDNDDNNSDQFSNSTSPEATMNTTISTFPTATTMTTNHSLFSPIQDLMGSDHSLLDHTPTVISPSQLQQPYHHHPFQQISLQNDQQQSNHHHHHHQHHHHHDNNNNSSNNSNNNMGSIKIENQTELSTNLLIGNSNNNNNNNNNNSNNMMPIKINQSELPTNLLIGNNNTSINNENNNDAHNNNNSNNSNNSILMEFTGNSQSPSIMTSFGQNSSSMYHPMLDHQQQQHSHPHHQQQQRQGSITSTTSSSFMEEELKTQILRLQYSYRQMHTFYTTELNKAKKIIEEQRLRTEKLERDLQFNR
ncbi:unnamed protein product [Cunninghamella echinulata]